MHPLDPPLSCYYLSITCNFKEDDNLDGEPLAGHGLDGIPMTEEDIDGVPSKLHQHIQCTM